MSSNVNRELDDLANSIKQFLWENGRPVTLTKDHKCYVFHYDSRAKARLAVFLHESGKITRSRITEQLDTIFDLGLNIADPDFNEDLWLKLLPAPNKMMELVNSIEAQEINGKFEEKWDKSAC